MAGQVGEPILQGCLEGSKNMKREFFSYTLHSGTADFSPRFYKASSNICINALIIVVTMSCLQEPQEEHRPWGCSYSATCLQRSCCRTEMSGFEYLIHSHCGPKQVFHVNRNDNNVHLTESLRRLNESEHQKWQEVPSQTCPMLGQAFF